MTKVTPVFLAAMLGACGSGNGGGTEMAADESKGGRTVEITLMHQFSPREVTIQAGETVTWRNSSNGVHTVTADSSRARMKDAVSLPPGVRPFHSGDLPPGKSYRQTFTVAGTYKYVCLYHEDKGMTGTVIVTPSETGTPSPY